MKLLYKNSVAVIHYEDDELEKLKKHFTLINRFEDKPPLEIFQLLADNHMAIPRESIKGDLQEFTWDTTKIAFQGTLRPEQLEVEHNYIAAISIGSGGIIKADTGFGKTILGISIMAKLGFPTMIVIPTTYLMEQWRERLLEFSDITESEIGTIQGRIADVKGKKVVLAMIHTLTQKKEALRVHECAFGLIIYDEVHTLSAPTFSEVGLEWFCKYRLGLSATPRRRDGMERVFIENIGPICAHGVRDAVSVTVISMEHKNVSACHTGYMYGDKLNLGGYLNKLVKLNDRNELLFNAVLASYKKGRKTLFLTDRISQINLITSKLQKAGVPLFDIGRFTSTLKQADKKIILGTYGSAGLGMDLPNINTLVLGTPRADIEQAVGRVLRGNYKITPVIIDCVDIASTKMVSWYMARRRYYKKLDATFASN